jgi:hypothetical protein
MTREEAAKRWEWVIENFNDSSVYLWSDQRQELLASIALLRGPQPDPDTGNVGKRVQGCWYCNDDVMQVADSPNKPPINATYCGLCGRKLEVEG